MSNGQLALVTGAPGWLGNRLMHFLRHPHPDYPSDEQPPVFDRVRCLVLPGAPQQRLLELVPDVEIVWGDIRDAQAVGRLCADARDATVFHLAGVIHPRKVREFYEINTEGAKHLIAAATAGGVRRIVATSSNSPAGASRDRRVIFDEDSPERPYLAYGRSKKAMEDALEAADASGAVETVIVRPCWYYGPEQPERQTRFFKMIKEGKVPLVGGGRALRSMSYVDNVALGLLLAAATPKAAGRTYWIADERPYAMSEIIDTIEDVLHKDFGFDVAGKRMKLPALASDVAYLADAALQTGGIYQQELHVLGEMRRTIACSIDRARSELGYEPSVDLREGMHRSIEWCINNGHQI